MKSDNIVISKEFLSILSKSKIISKIDELEDLFLNTAQTINLDRIILYEYIGNNKMKVVFIYSKLDNDIKKNNIVDIKDNINLANSLKNNTLSKIPVPDIGEDMVIPINKQYFLAIDDIYNARVLTDIDELLLLYHISLSMNTSIKMMKLIEDNTKDALTGIFNRGVLNKFLEFNETPYNKPYPRATGISFIDIDFFGNFNKKYGHDIGDIILKETANILKMFFEKYGGIIYRYGGEEFVGILLNNTIDIEILSIVIQEHFDNLVIENNNIKYFLTLSIGTSQYGDDLELNNIEHIKRANKALLIAKETGRNKVIDFSSIANI